MGKPFVDLDALVEESVQFKFKGNIYTLKPMSIETFMKFNNAWWELQQLIKQDKISSEEGMNISVSLIKSVCDDLPEEKIRKEMSVIQIAGLVQLVIEKVTARDPTDESIKKKVMNLREPRLPV